MIDQDTVSILINNDWCKRCGICVAICPRGVFVAATDGLPLVKQPEACTKCQLCELICPDFAIQIAS
ncbi:MAG: 4Fe-4S binding protein [Chloroflexi bacterium]|nr:4Fe-4S binding protein [Chloroflexota bacterium]MCL5074292.1 4Fe-4S binding protein [Chloroflexota bacterium]